MAQMYEKLLKIHHGQKFCNGPDHRPQARDFLLRVITEISGHIPTLPG